MTARNGRSFRFGIVAAQARDGEHWTATARQAESLGYTSLLMPGSAAVLTGSVEQMADTLERRRDQLGISYVVTNAAFMTALAPVVERLSGR